MLLVSAADAEESSTRRRRTEAADGSNQMPVGISNANSYPGKIAAVADSGFSWRSAVMVSGTMLDPMAKYWYVVVVVEVVVPWVFCRLVAAEEPRGAGGDMARHGWITGRGEEDRICLHKVSHTNASARSATTNVQLLVIVILFNGWLRL